MSDSHDLSSPVSSSKLIPAAAPTVSAWGKKQEAAAPAAPAQIKKEEWPAADAVLAKDVVVGAPKESTKEKARSAPSKAKSGKEKWVPYEATIILPAGNNGTQQKKKGNSSGNANANTNKKKQGQNTNNQNNQNNGRHKKDGQGQKNNQNGQKKQSDTGNNQNGNQQKKKNNGQANGSNKAQKSVTEGIASLNLKTDKENQKSRELTVESSSIKSPSPTTKPAVTATTPKNKSAKPVITPPTIDDNASTVTTAPSMSAATDYTDATSPSAPHANVQKQNKQQPQPYQQQYQPQPPQPPQQMQQQPQYQQPNQHRNSEPFAGGNNNFYNNSSGNRGRKNNKHYNNTRHSVAGTGFNMPYYNYGGYMPMMTPNQYGYAPSTFGSFAKPTNSRSHSQSPSKADLTATLNPVVPNVPGITPFAPQPVMFNPYGSEADPLTAVVNQLNYYFSNENLSRDFFLRRLMNSQGYVPLKNLIQFNRLHHLTGGDFEMMMTALKRAPSLEVHNEKVRVMNTWMNWVLPFDNRDEAGKVEEAAEEQNNENDQNQA